MMKTPVDPDLSPDPYWIRIQELSGSGSTNIEDKLKKKDARFKTEINNKET